MRAYASTVPAVISSPPISASQMPKAWSARPAIAGGSLTSWLTTITTVSTDTSSEVSGLIAGLISPSPPASETAIVTASPSRTRSSSS